MRHAREGINERKRKAVENVIATMVRELDPALGNDSEIARRAGVHRNFVAKFSAEIEVARAEVNRRYLTGQGSKAALSVAAIRADYETLKQHAAQLDRQNRALRKRLGIALGDEAVEADLGTDLRPALDALREQRDTHAVRVTELELELHGMHEELDAARRTNRRLMREQNLTTPAA